MNILHVCWGTGTNNGAANIARLIMDEQRSAGDSPTLVSRPTWAQLKAADQIWCHCGWYWVFWLLAAYRRFFHSTSTSTSISSSPSLHWVPECCYDPVRLRYHGWKKRLVGPIERWALRQADVLVATCEAEAGWIREYLKLGRGECAEHVGRPKIVVSDIKRFFNLTSPTPSPIPYSLLPLPSSLFPITSPLKVLYLGRPHPLKGVKYLERAVEQVNRRGGRAGRVVLRQVSDHHGEELERDWEWCDVLCLPTLSDNFGLVIAEALSRGKRVLTTDGAPAWDPEHSAVLHSKLHALTYLKGYRNGDDAMRVKLLADALERMTSASTAVVSLGSNIEPRARYLADALAALAALPQTRLERASSVIETEPMDVPDEFAGQKFLNQVAVFSTALDPRDFSRRMHQIEDDLGRVRTVRNGPRTIDLDLIDFGGIKLDDPELTLPHPRAKSRPFVTRPLAELGITL